MTTVKEPLLKRRLPSTLPGALAALGGIVVGGVCLGALYQSLASVRDRRKYPPPGRMIPVDGVIMHTVVGGRGREGAPTVILDTGLGGMSSAWGWLQPEVASFARVVSFDRAGLGWSEKVREQTSGVGKARRLHALLKAAGIEGPYLLVGHSMAGLLVRIFHDLYPDEVAGVVMLDPCHPDQRKRHKELRKHMNAGFSMLKTVPLLTRIGYVRLRRLLDSEVDGLPDRQRAESCTFLSSYEHLSATNDDALCWDRLCDEVRSTRDLADKPLTVVTAGKGLRTGAFELQQELAALSSQGRQVVIRRADHVTLVTHRDHALAVAAEIRRMVDQLVEQGSGAVAG